jgi:hypothetical protein
MPPAQAWAPRILFTSSIQEPAYCAAQVRRILGVAVHVETFAKKARKPFCQAAIYKAVKTEVPAAANTVDISVCAKERKHCTTTGSN